MQSSEEVGIALVNGLTRDSKMISHGMPPYLECSSKGDSRFSAFYARIRARGSKSIEDIYQAAKVFEDGSTGLGWREAKGKRASNMHEVILLYATLWDEYIEENPLLKSILTAASGLSDRFGQPGHCCQATELWRIRVRELGAVKDLSQDHSSQTSSRMVATPKQMVDIAASGIVRQSFQSDLFEDSETSSKTRVRAVAASSRRAAP